MTGEELAQFRMELGKTQSEFADMVGITRGYLSQVEMAESELISKQLLFKLRKRFPPSIRQVADLMDGLIDEAVLDNSLLNEPSQMYKSKQTGIPIFDVDVTMTPIEVFNDQTTIPSYYIEMPAFADCDFGINVYGHSMYPTIESGMVALCKELQDKSIIAYGEIYFLVTKDFRMVKRILKSERRGYIIAASDNHNGHASPDGKTYAPIEISLDKILHIYMVKGCFKRYMI